MRATLGIVLNIDLELAVVVPRTADRSHYLLETPIIDYEAINTINRLFILLMYSIISNYKVKKLQTHRIFSILAYHLSGHTY